MAEFLVNTYTDDNQQRPAIAGLSDGGFVVAWQSRLQDGSGTGVYAQVYTAAGELSGDEFRVNSYTNNGQDAPSVTGLTGGGFVVTWHGTSDLDSSGNGVFGQLYDVNGDAVGGEFLINTETDSYQVTSNVSAMADGGFIVSWQSRYQDGDADGVFGQQFAADGTKVGTEFQANNLVTDGYQGASATAGLTGGGYVVVFSSQDRDADGTAIVARQYADDGTPVGDEFIVNTETALGQQRPDVTALDDGGYVVVWESAGQDNAETYYYGIYAQRFDENGDPFGTEFLVNTETIRTQRNPKITTIEDGGFVIVWESEALQTSHDNVHGQRYDSDGVAVGDEFVINTETTGTQVEPEVAGLSDGGFVVTWETTIGAVHLSGIFGQRFDVNGDPIDMAPTTNEAPTVDATQTNTELAEDVDTAARIKVADITITDDDGLQGDNGNVLALSGDDAGLFELDGTELYLSAGAALDFETNGALDVTVSVDDDEVGDTPDDTVDVSVTVTDANEAPSLTFVQTATDVREDADTSGAATIKIGDITVTDDALQGAGGNALSLSGDDAALFDIVGTELYLAAGAALDFAANPVLDVTINVDDDEVGATPDDSHALTVSVIERADLSYVSAAVQDKRLDVGQDLAIDITVGNDGGSTANATSTIYWSSDDSFDVADVAIATRDHGDVDAGDQTSDTGISVSYDTIAAQGDGFLFAVLDTGDLVDEADEDNNVSAAMKIEVEVLDAPAADLTLSNFTLSETSIGNEGKVTFSVDVSNAGGTAARAKTSYWYSTDAVFDAGDIHIKAGDRHGVMEAGETLTGETRRVSDSKIQSAIAKHAGPTGDHYILAVVDAPDKIYESNETNNVQSVEITLDGGADLYFEDLVLADDTLAQGQRFEFQAEVGNQGDDAARAKVKYYLSDDDTLDGTDVLVRTEGFGKLDAGETDTGRDQGVKYKTVARTLTDGDGFLLAVLDEGGRVAETDETNNVIAKALSLDLPGDADLQVSDISTDTAALQSSDLYLQVHYEVSNTGETAAVGRTSFFVSDDTTLDGGDALLVTDFNATLRPGEVDGNERIKLGYDALEAALVALGAGSDGYVIAMIDYDDTVSETSEVNNASDAVYFELL